MNVDPNYSQNYEVGIRRGYPLPIMFQAIVKLKLSKKFKLENDTTSVDDKSFECRVGCIDFDISGKLAAVVSNDYSINLFNCKYGKKINTLYSKKYGVNKLNFLTDNSLIFSSDKPNLTSDLKSHALRLLDFETNNFLKYFTGHTDYVCNLKVNPADRTFVSTGLDGKCFLWDSREDKPVDNFLVPAIDGLAIDPSGRVIALADNRYVNKTSPSNQKGGILLFDVRNISKGGFKFIYTNDNQDEDAKTKKEIGCIKFTNCGEKLIIRDTMGYFQIREAITGMLTHPTLYQTYPNLQPTTDPNHLFTLTPDGRYLLAGANDGRIDVFDLNLNSVSNTDPQVNKLRTKYQAVYRSKKVTPSWRINGGDFLPLHVVQFNPKFFTLIAGDSTIKLFEPKWWL